MALVSVDQQRGFPSHGRQLLGALDDPNPELRRRAVVGLRGCADCAQLLDLLQREDDLSVRQALFDALAADGGPQAVTGLVDLLRSEDANLRNEAITTLQELGDAVSPHIDGLLAAEDADVRIFAVNILRDLRCRQTVTWLCQVLERDDQPNVVGTALDHTLELATPEMQPAIEQAMGRFPGDSYITFVGNLILDRLEREAP